MPLPPIRPVYAITPAGREALAGWFDTPVAEPERPRNELAIKLLMAATTPGVDVTAVVQRQRNESLRQLRDYTALRREANEADDVAWVLLLDSFIFTLEGETRWLDHVEATVLAVDLPATDARWEPPRGAMVGMLRDSGPSPSEQAVRAAGVTLVIGFAGAQMALLAGAAFAVSARRQRRDLAMVGAVGASNRQVSRVVLANGVVLGAAAGIAGIALGRSPSGPAAGWWSASWTIHWWTRAYPCSGSPVWPPSRWPSVWSPRSARPAVWRGSRSGWR